MSIRQETREEFGQEVTLYRWECLQHPTKQGMWVKDADTARRGMRAHLHREHESFQVLQP